MANRTDRTGHNSTLHRRSIKRQEQDKKAGGKPKAWSRKTDLGKVKERFKIVTAAMIGPPTSPFKNRKPIRKVSKTNKGWWDVALDIWRDRDHKCEVCGCPLGDVPTPIFFSHLLPRGSYRRFKRLPENIRLKCERHHKEWHQNGPEILQVYLEWKSVAKLYFTLRDRYNGLTNGDQV